MRKRNPGPVPRANDLTILDPAKPQWTAAMRAARRKQVHLSGDRLDEELAIAHMQDVVLVDAKNHGHDIRRLGLLLGRRLGLQLDPVTASFLCKNPK